MKGVLMILKKNLLSWLALFFLGLLGTALFIWAYDSSRNMEYTLRRYYEQQQLGEVQLHSELGFGEDMIKELVREGERAEAFFQNKLGNGLTLISFGGVVNIPEVLQGRLPENETECAVGEGLLASGRLGLGSQLDLSGLSDLPLKAQNLTVVGVVSRPERLRMNESDFLLVRQEALAAGVSYSDAFFRRESGVNRDYFSLAYSRDIEVWQQEISKRAALWATRRSQELEEEYLQAQLEAFADLNRDSDDLARREAVISQEAAQREELIQQYTQQAEEAEQALRDISGDRGQFQEVFAARLSGLETLRGELDQLRQISELIQGDLVVAENKLNQPELAPMLSPFRGCANQILSAYITADLTNAAQMEKAVEQARDNWDEVWQVFRSSLSETSRLKLEEAVGRSLVSLGLELSNSLKTYGSRLQSSAGSDPELREAVRELAEGSSPSRLTTRVSSKLGELQKELESQEEEYLSLVEEVGDWEKDYQEKQNAQALATLLLSQAKADYEDWKKQEQDQLLKEREDLEAERLRLTRIYDEKRADLDRRQQTAYAVQSIFETQSSLGDQQLFLKLIRQLGWGILGVVLLALILTAGTLLGRLLKEAGLHLPEDWCRQSRMDMMIKAGGILLVLSLLGVIGGTLLGQRMARILTPGLLKDYSMKLQTLSGGGSWAMGMIIWLGPLLPALGLALLLAPLQSGQRSRLGNNLNLFITGGILGLVLGSGLFLGYGWLEGRERLGASWPALLALAALGALLLLGFGLILSRLLYRSAELVNWETERDILRLLRASGNGKGSGRRWLLGSALWPLLAGILCGVGGTALWFSLEQGILAPEGAGLSRFLPGLLAVPGALTLAFLGGQAIRKKASRLALTDRG